MDGREHEIGVLGWDRATSSGPGCTRFARVRTDDRRVLSQTGCLEAGDSHFGLAATPSGWLLGTRAGYHHPGEHPYDIRVHRIQDGAVSEPWKVAASELVFPAPGGGGPIFSDARLVSRPGGGPLLVFTSGADTSVVLLDEAGKPVWTPKVLPPATAGAANEQVPKIGGAVWANGAFYVLRYSKTRDTTGYNWEQGAAATIARVDLTGTATQHALPEGAWTSALALGGGDEGPVLASWDGRDSKLLRFNGDGTAGRVVPLSLVGIPHIHAVHGFAGETWLVATDFGARHAVTDRSRVLLYRVADDGDVLERREISERASDVNEQAFLGVAGGEAWAGWKSGGFFMRRMALAFFDLPRKPEIRAPLVTPETSGR